LGLIKYDNSHFYINECNSIAKGLTFITYYLTIILLAMKRISSLKNIYYFLMICLPFNYCISQEIPEFGKITTTDFAVQSTLIDSGTSGVILFDYGTLNFIGNENNWLSYEFKQHTRIKLIGKQSFDLATVRIRLFGKEENADKLSDVKATTYNLESGKLVSTKLESKDIYDEKVNSFTNVKKFTMPALKEGSIIEFEYTITSFRYWSLPSWRFQHLNYPCLLSKCDVVIPRLLTYLISHTGNDSAVYIKKELEKKVEYQMMWVKVSSIAVKHSWVINNVPAFKIEDYLYYKGDYLDKVDFFLLQTYNGEKVSNVAVNWSDAVKNNLVKNSNFGLLIDDDHTINLQNLDNKLCGNENDATAISHILYGYIRDNFICNEDDDIYLGDDLYDINKKRKGNVSELNMLLIGLLRQKGIKADPLILSTREYGVNSAIYPLLNKMNYVVCRLIINGETILLDASKPYLGFGNLPLKCYNGHSRVIDKEVHDSIMLHPDSVMEKRSVTVNISNDKKGFISGLCEIRPGRFQSDNFREEIPKNGMKHFFEDIKTQLLTDSKINNQGIDSLDKVEMPLLIHFEFETPVDSTADLIYFSPVIGMMIKDNPFKAEKREYPVEMDYPFEETYTLNLEIPEGYEVAELPKSTRVKLNDTEGAFQYMISQSGNDISLQCRTQVNTAIFYPNEYQTLRDFYGFIMKKLEEQIVFKKKK
jgi:hypothetical protein